MDEPSLISTWDPRTTRLATLCRTHNRTGVFELIREAVDEGAMTMPHALRVMDAMSDRSGPSPDDVLRELRVDPSRIVHALDGPERHATDVVDRLWPGLRPRDHDVAWMAVRAWAIRRRCCFVEDVWAAIRGGYAALSEYGLAQYVLPSWSAGWSGLHTLLREDERRPAQIDALLEMPPGGTEAWLGHVVRLAIVHPAVHGDILSDEIAMMLGRMSLRLTGAHPDLDLRLELATSRLLQRAGKSALGIAALIDYADHGEHEEAVFDALVGALRRDIETDLSVLAGARSAFETRAAARDRSAEVRARWTLLARACEQRLARLTYAPLATGEAADGMAGTLAAILRARGVGLPVSGDRGEIRRAMGEWNRRTIGLDDEETDPTDPEIESRHAAERWVAFLDVVADERGEPVVVAEDVHWDEALVPRPEDAWSRR